MSRRGTGPRRAALAVGAVLAVASGLGAPRLSAQEGPLLPLDTLHVDVASRTEADLPARSRAIEVLTPERLRALPVRTVAEALRWMTGMDVQPRSAAQTDLSIRGSTFEQVVVLVDGVRMSDPQTGHFDLDLAVPLDAVERIEVLRGPASALYGADAVGGVVNVVTRRGDGAPGGSARLEGGSFSTWRAGLAGDGAAGGVRASGAGEWARSDGHRAGTDYENVLLSGRASADVGGGVLAFQGGHARRDFGADSFYAKYPSYEETRTSTVSLGWAGAVGGGVTLHPLVSWRRHDDDFVLIRENPGVYRNVHRSSQTGGELVGRWQGGGAALAVGGEAYRDDLESTNVATGRPALGDRTEDRAAGFVEAAWAGGAASVTAGLRADWHEGFGDAWSPSLSASLDLTSSLRARAAWGRSFRAPTWTDRYYEDPGNRGDPDLEPETGWSVEAGVDLALPGTGVLRATAFRRDTENLIDWVKPAGSPPGTQAVARNVEEATFDGLEVGVEGLTVAGLRLDASATLLRLEAEEAAGLVSRYALRPLTRQVTAALTRELLDGRLLLSARTLHERRLPAAGEPSDPHTRFGARALVGLPAGELTLDGTNLGDERYLDVAGNVAAGRALAIGYRLRIGGGR